MLTAHTTHAGQFGANGIAEITIEEMGRKLDATLVLSAHWIGEYAEDRTWDYPGSDARLWIESVQADEYSCGDTVVTREQRPDWFELLDLIAEAAVNRDRSEYETAIGSEIDEDCGTRHRRKQFSRRD